MVSNKNVVIRNEKKKQMITEEKCKTYKFRNIVVPYLYFDIHGWNFVLEKFVVRVLYMKKKIAFVTISHSCVLVK